MEVLPAAWDTLWDAAVFVQVVKIDDCHPRDRWWSEGGGLRVQTVPIWSLM